VTGHSKEREDREVPDDLVRARERVLPDVGQQEDGWIEPVRMEGGLLLLARA
jgi:hypothetical protein